MSVAVIRDAALRSQQQPVVRMLAEETCRYLPSKDCVSEALAFYHLVLDKTRYMRDPRTIEYIRAPWRVIPSIMAGQQPGLDCDDMTALLCALLLASGSETRAVTVAFVNATYRGERQYSHVFAQAREPRTGQWITLDPVAGNRTKEMLSRVVNYKIWPIA